jgi:hypothetical protein
MNYPAAELRVIQCAVTQITLLVIVHPIPNPPPSRGRELIRSADKYSPSTGGRGLGRGGAELLPLLKLSLTRKYPALAKRGEGRFSEL